MEMQDKKIIKFTKDLLEHCDELGFATAFVYVNGKLATICYTYMELLNLVSILDMDEYKIECDDSLKLTIYLFNENK